MTKSKAKPKMTRAALLSKTCEVLAKMLKENTGASMLDSGSAYGRNWERNQARTFEAEPNAHFSITIFEKGGKETAEIMCIKNVYHWLKKRLTYAPEINQRFQNYINANGEMGYREAIENFPIHLRESGEYVTGLYGDEDSSFDPTYTYNHENCISQDIQFVLFEVEEHGKNVPYVALQIHGGCDARGGLTRPRIFEITGDSDQSSIFDYGRISMYGNAPKPTAAEKAQGALPGVEPVTPDDVYWDSEDGGYSFRLSDSTNWGKAEDFKDYPTTTDPTLRGKGFTFVDRETKQVYCPVSGYELHPH